MAKAKRRNLRVQPDSDRQGKRFEHTVRPDQTGDASASSGRFNRFSSYYFLFFGIFLPVVTLIAYTVYRTKYTQDTDGVVLSVYERGLVRPNLDYQEILNENSKVPENTPRRHYSYPVLAYITPWNSRGYELAKRFSSKVTHLSPVWYDLKSEGNLLVLEGRHNADLGWLTELKMNGRALVLPRIVLEAFPIELLKKKKKREEAIALIVAECGEMDYDGVVLESWSRWAAYGILHDQQMRNRALQFVKELGKALHSVRSVRTPEHHLQLVYVISPPGSENLQAHEFGPKDLQTLDDAVDGFSLMTYDFSSPQNPGPNAPLQWIKSTLHILLSNTGKDAKSLARKIFLGINFYGNDYVISKGLGGEAITSREYLSLLEKHRPAMKWDENSKEHIFGYADSQGIKHAVFYPSLMSISMRLEEARVWGVGISIWEIGQVGSFSSF